MQFMAVFEVGATVSIVEDEITLDIRHPKGTYRARITNIARAEYTVPFLLNVHLYFDAADSAAAKEQAPEHLSDLLNMLAFTTGGGFRKHRIRQIVQAENPAQLVMRDVWMWGERIEYDDPQPFIEQDTATTIEKLLEADVSRSVKRALRWYRLGIDSESPDDQFAYFWFALEIIAESQKSTERVNDRCPKCKSPLYCESCSDHPTHRPYAKQAIRQLMKLAEPESEDEKFQRLDDTRNALMHGSTLKEIESTLPEPHEHVVDELGRLLWNALVLCFPREFFNGSLSMGKPSTYIHYKMDMIAQMQTVIPTDEAGNFKPDFSGVKMETVPFGPPQSAAPFFMRLTDAQYKKLLDLSYMKSEHQKMLERICSRPQKYSDDVVVMILATDMKVIKKHVSSDLDGEWFEVFRQVLEAD